MNQVHSHNLTKLKLTRPFSNLQRPRTASRSSRGTRARSSDTTGIPAFHFGSGTRPDVALPRSVGKARPWPGARGHHHAAHDKLHFIGIVLGAGTFVQVHLAPNPTNWCHSRGHHCLFLAWCRSTRGQAWPMGCISASRLLDGLGLGAHRPGCGSGCLWYSCSFDLFTIDMYTS